MRGLNTFPVALLAAAALAALGCVSTSDIEALHTQIADVQRQVAEAQTQAPSKQDVGALEARMGRQMESLLKTEADMQVKLQNLSSHIDELQAKLEDTNRRLSQLSQQIAETQGDLARLRPPAASGSTPPQNPSGARIGPGSGEIGADTTSVRAPAGTHPSPKDLYDTAYADYNKGRYPLAIQGFQEYLSAYPNTDLSDNAQYWIGECLSAQKKHKEAIAAFDKLLKQWPQSDKAAAALLKKGYALIDLGQKAEAVVQLQYVMHEFPAAEESRLARARLRSMGIETR